MTNEEINKNIEALELVKKLNIEQMAFIHHHSNGDEITYAVAFERVLERKNIICDFYDMSDVDIKIYDDKYNLEISDESDRIIQYGKKEINFMKEVEKHLDFLMRDQRINLK